MLHRLVVLFDDKIFCSNSKNATCAAAQLLSRFVHVVEDP